METRRPKEDLNKTVIETADLSIDMLKEVITQIKTQSDELKNKNKEMNDELNKSNMKVLTLTNLLLKINCVETLSEELRNEIRTVLEGG